VSHSGAPKSSDAWPDRPLAGISMHFTSLPSPFGIGDIDSSARTFIDRLAALRLGVWQVLPTGPTAYRDSPYQPLSAFAGNEMLIGFDPLLNEGLLREEELKELQGLPSESVQYGAIIPLKRSLLEGAAERFLETGRDRVQFDAFLERNDDAWLHEYALYRVLKTLHRERPWPEWSAEYARRERSALDKIERDHRQAIEHVKATQFFFDKQWNALRRHAADRNIRLFGDMPFYIALDSSDAWAGRELLLIDSSGRPAQVAGVPPDYFSDEGQLWGNPLYDWEYHEKTAYRWWIERLRAAAQRCDMVRVDHFRGFESYWSIPGGARTARQGMWKPGPGDALLNALAETLGQIPVVAEDLGIITDEVIQLRRRHGIPGMKVLQFEIAEPDFNPARIPEDCLCYTATHDNDTTAAWFSGKGRDPRTRKEIRKTRTNALRLTGGTAASIARDMIRLAYSTPARVALAPMQDYLGLGSEARMNTPGTQRNNWRWRLTEDPLSPDVCEEIAALVEASSRC